MSLLPLPTDLHDALIEEFAFDQLRGRLTIGVLLAVPEGLRTERKQILLSGVRNGKEVAQLQQQFERILRKFRRLVPGCLLELEDLSYADPTASPKAELAIRLAIDHLPALIIQCKKFTVPSSALGY
jgi:hypothetical protein